MVTSLSRLALIRGGIMKTETKYGIAVAGYALVVTVTRLYGTKNLLFPGILVCLYFNYLIFNSFFDAVPFSGIKQSLAYVFAILFSLLSMLIYVSMVIIAFAGFGGESWMIEFGVISMGVGYLVLFSTLYVGCNKVFELYNREPEVDEKKKDEG